MSDAFPEFKWSWTALIEAAQTLRESGKPSEAETLLAQGTRIFPNEMWIAYHFAHSASLREDWQVSLQRWNDVLQRFGPWPPIIVEYVKVLRANGRFSESAALAARGLVLYPDDPWIAHEDALNTEAAGDWSATARKWQQVVTRFPQHAAGYTAGASALKLLGRFSDADILLEAGLKALPNELWISYHYALNATVQCHWEEAIRRWSVFRQQFPMAHEGAINLAVAFAEAGETLLGIEMVCEAIRQFGALKSLLEARARIFEMTRNWDGAINSWTASYKASEPAVSNVETEHNHDWRKLYNPGLLPDAFGFWHDESYGGNISVGLWKHIFDDKYKVVTNHVILELIERHFQDLGPAYRRIAIPACQADIARLIYLYVHGGLYLDMHCTIGNTRKLDGLRTLYERYEATFYSYPPKVSSEHHVLGNSIIMSRPRSMLLKRLIEVLTKNLLFHMKQEDNSTGFVPYNIYSLTGPGAIEREITIGGDPRSIADAYIGKFHIVEMTMTRAEDAIHPFYFYSYRKPGSHWSERQQREALFSKQS